MGHYFAFSFFLFGLILLLVFCCRGCWGEVQRGDVVLWCHKGRKKEHELVICATLQGNCWGVKESMALWYTAAQYTNIIFTVLVLTIKWLNWNYFESEVFQMVVFHLHVKGRWCIIGAYHRVYLPCNVWDFVTSNQLLSYSLLIK